MSILAYDLAGRELGVSAIDLLGGKVRDRVPAYDTTLYFQDLRNPDHLNNGIASIVDEAKEAHSLGYRQMKIKVGRGGRWMSPAFGAQRDADVVNSIRAAVGPETILYVDANFGYKNRLDLLEFFIKETLHTCLQISHLAFYNRKNNAWINLQKHTRIKKRAR